MIWENKKLRDMETRINKLDIELTKRDLLISDLQMKLQNSIPFEERVATLEIWSKKLQDLITAKTVTGKETLSPYGKRMFGGKSKGYN